MSPTRGPSRSKLRAPSWPDRSPISDSTRARQYDAVLSRASQSSLESSNTTQTNVSALKTATPPVWSPAFLALNTGVAALLGLALGAWLALAAEGRDRRVRSVADITERLQQPLMLVLPNGTR